jgi:flagellin-like protein
MRKGITPIISVIILLLITVALAGAAWSYMNGIFTSQTSKSFSVNPNPQMCDIMGNFNIYVHNTGTSAIRAGWQSNGGDWIDAKAQSSGGRVIWLTGPTIPVGSTVTINQQPVLNESNETVSPKGDRGDTYYITLVTSSTTYTGTTTCP